jgi:hypothetical protein
MIFSGDRVDVICEQDFVDGCRDVQEKTIFDARRSQRSIRVCFGELRNAGQTPY